MSPRSASLSGRQSYSFSPKGVPPKDSHPSFKRPPFSSHELPLCSKALQRKNCSSNKGTTRVRSLPSTFPPRPPSPAPLLHQGSSPLKGSLPPDFYPLKLRASSVPVAGFQRALAPGSTESQFLFHHGHSGSSRPPNPGGTLD
ncbi:hypothetical protein E2C01_091297 [Portunus trituberculatus]|uniref:Uncharacterized protein n=1 Tax=Portunus trituberculatus TaxID=210409 RepID=A0A5B7JH48_PORTR|nr:hypothetical protein [Portunus trituberculatus]